MGAVVINLGGWWRPCTSGGCNWFGVCGLTLYPWDDPRG